MSRIGAYTLLKHYQNDTYSISHALLRRHKYCHPCFEINNSKLMFVTMGFSYKYFQYRTEIQFIKANVRYEITLAWSYRRIVKYFNDKPANGRFNHMLEKIYSDCKNFKSMIQLLPLLEQI